MERISRDEALARGLKKYFTGTPCKHGHAAQRYTVTTACVKCMAEAQKRFKQSQYNRLAETEAVFKDMHPDDIRVLKETAAALVAARSLSEGTSTTSQTSAHEVSSRVDLIRRQLYGSAA
jgi:hypothetical protein